MKRKLLFLVAFIGIAITFNSCEGLTGCKVCKQVFYLDNAWDHDGSDTEYCGAELLTIEATGRVTIGVYEAEYQCR